MKTLQDLHSIDGKIFATRKGTWRARIADRVDPAATDRTCYAAEFRLIEEAAPARNLSVWVLDADLQFDRDSYHSKIFDCVEMWLETESPDSVLFFRISGGSVLSFPSWGCPQVHKNMLPKLN